jgi:transposase InsO family protein
MRVVSVLVLAAVLAAGGVVGWLVARGTASEDTVTETVIPAAPAQGLPAAVETTHAALLAAAESGDYSELRPLVPATLRYTFGSPVEGGPIAYWQELERTTGARPLDTLAEILRMPYVLSRGLYVWPWAYTIESAADLSAHERELLAPLGPVATLLPPGSGYLGWRAGIEPDGDWAFFVAGD